MRRTLLRFGFRQARRHPRMALKLTAAAARHPRRTRTLVRVARSDVPGTIRAVNASYRAAAARARRRARARRVAVGASVVGVAAYAGRSRR